jgi:N-carbamoyl-L-amino-acid hydrolase
MPRRLRRDAVVAGARLVAAMQALWLRREAAGEDLTVTFGEFFTDPAQHSFSKVPGRAQLCLDVRSESEATLAGVRAEFLETAARIAAECGVAIEPGPLTGSTPARMDEGLNARLAAAAEGLGIPARRMPSGAGHDAAVFAQAGIPATMLFVRNAHGSHNPDEHMELADFDRALEVLHSMIAQWRQP